MFLISSIVRNLLCYTVQCMQIHTWLKEKFQKTFTLTMHSIICIFSSVSFKGGFWLQPIKFILQSTNELCLHLPETWHWVTQMIPVRSPSPVSLSLPGPVLCAVSLPACAAARSLPKLGPLVLFSFSSQFSLNCFPAWFIFCLFCAKNFRK